MYGLLRDDAGAFVALTAGVVNAIAGTYTGEHVFQNQRAAIDYVLDAFGGERRVNPDFSIDFGIASDLFVTTPTALVVRHGAGGRDPGFDGVPLAKFTTGEDARDFTTRAVVLAQGQGETLITGTADVASNPYNDPQGDDVVRTRLVSESETSPGNADARAQLVVNRFSGTRKAIAISTDEYDVEGVIAPGDTIYVYDPEGGLVDTTNEARFRGRVLNPEAIRCFAVGFPVTDRMGVYIRRSGSPATWLDVSEVFVPESGPTTLTVGAHPRSATEESEPQAVAGKVFVDPDGNDATIPDAPAHTSTPWATSSYVDDEGRTRAQIVASWSQPLNTDASTIVDGSHYVVRWRRNGETVYQTTAVPFDTTSFNLQDLAPGVTYEISVAAYDTASPPNSNGFAADESVVASADTVAPSTPASATIAGNPLEILVEHDLGKSTGGTFNLESDLDHLNVYISTSSGFTPSASNLAGKIPANAGHLSLGIKVIGRFQIVDTTARFVKVTAVDKAGNESAASAQSTVSAVLISDAHVADLTVDKLTAGTINTGTISVASVIEVAAGGIIRTAASGNRVELGGTDFDRVKFFTGHANEEAEGFIQVRQASGLMETDIKGVSNSASSEGSVGLLFRDGDGGANPPEWRFYYDGDDSDPILTFQNGYQLQVDSSGASVTRPNIAALNDPNTGFWWKDSDDVSIVLGGVELIEMTGGASIHKRAVISDSEFQILGNDGVVEQFPGEMVELDPPTWKADTTDPTADAYDDQSVGHTYRIGNVVFFHIVFQFDSAGVGATEDGSGAYYWDPAVDGLPRISPDIYADSHLQDEPCGVAVVKGSSSTREAGYCEIDAGFSRIYFRLDDRNNRVSNSVPFAWDEDDLLSFSGFYLTDINA